MNDYIKLNEDRWNNVKNDYTEPLTHEQLEEARNNPISVALTVGTRLWQFWEKNIVRKVDFIEKNQLFYTSLFLYTGICGIIYMRW